MMPFNDLAPRIPLDGTWDFRLGDQDSWGEIHVPGAWEAQGYDRRLDGPAYYQRQVTVPHEWAGSRIVLELSAVSYACRVTVNGVCVGEHQGLWTPFACDLTAAIHPGRPNLIEIEVYKPSHLPGARYPFRKSLAGFIPDLGTTFGGLWQEVSLRAYRNWFEDWHLTADTDAEEIICSFRTCPELNWDVEEALVDISVSLQGNQVATLTVEPNLSADQEVRCKVPQPRRWSPERPVLYEVELSLRLGDQVLAKVHRRIGFRRLSTRGEMLLFNDHPVLLRGILHWGWLPDQIAPIFSIEEARAQFREVKRLGFNLIKLCLFVPNSAFYEAADEEGIFLWQEWPMWLPQVDPAYAAHAPEEYAEYMSLVRDHPSIVIYSAGCELDEAVGADLLERLNGVMRQGMSGALFCDNSGMGEAYGGLQVDFADFSDYHTYSDLEFFEEMLDHWRRDWQPSRPLIFGEFCDSDTYREPEEIRALSGELGDLAPWWLTNDNPLMDWSPHARPALQQEESIVAAGLVRAV
jgi:beta-galactosidase/beta-glucuronidase